MEEYYGWRLAGPAVRVASKCRTGSTVMSLVNDIKPMCTACRNQETKRRMRSMGTYGTCGRSAAIPKVNADGERGMRQQSNVG